MFARQVKVENYQAVELHEYAVAVAKCAVPMYYVKNARYFCISSVSVSLSIISVNNIVRMYGIIATHQ